jgi:hypothetical protein
MTRTCSIKRRYPWTSPRLLITGPIAAEQSLSCPSLAFVRRDEPVPD